MNDQTRFANYPSAVAYYKPKSRAIKNAAQHLLWGDWVKLTGKLEGTWCESYVRGVNGKVWIHKSDLVEDRLLEVNFVDIGQGDGCLIITPDDKKIVVDAGEQDNMLRFLRWRFGRFNNTVNFESFIITHPDSDHYRGFRGLLKHHNVQVDTLFHNGIVERQGAERFGPTQTIKGIKYLKQVIRNKAALEKLLESEAKTRKPYIKLLGDAVESGRVGDIRMLSSRDGYLPSYDKDQKVSVQVLSPVPEHGCKLRWFGNPGKTKNGHSIVLRLVYDNVSILLGGDLNIPAENYLLKNYTGIDPEKASVDDQRNLLMFARQVFQSDVAKACHHGSADFSTTFLRAVNPMATVISSGDNEPHAHPRPDALGTFGRCGRGFRPLIFSTELARSSRETIKEPNKLRNQMNQLLNEITVEKQTEKSKKAKDKLAKVFRDITKRSVAVYGMISLRTDGDRVIIAQRLGRARSKKSKWDIHCFEMGSHGLAYQSKYKSGKKNTRNIAKRIFLHGLNCLTRAWYDCHLPQRPATEPERFRFEQGIELGRLSRKLYPEGVEVRSAQVAQATAITQRLMADQTVKTLFEAAFQVGDYVARADILVRAYGGWKLIEVKSSKFPLENEKKKLSELIDDLSYTALVATMAGVPIKNMSLLTINPKYRISVPVDNMFVDHEMTTQVKLRLKELKKYWETIAKTSGGRKRPHPAFNSGCKKCGYFAEKCLGLGIEYPATELPQIGRSPKKMEAIGTLKQPNIKLIPGNLKLTEAQDRVRNAVNQKKPIFSKNLNNQLSKIVWPAYYLDFETTSTAIPLYPGVSPWEQIVTQYSIHICSKLGEKNKPKAYLAEFDRDCRLELAEKLIGELGTNGSIIVYSSFEKQMINALKKRFPQFKKELNSLIARLFDLHKVITECYYHPKFHGSTSIKTVLSALINDNSYKNLTIQNGDAAVTAFARAALNQYTESQKQQIRQDLLEYCNLDTWAMVQLHKHLVEIGKAQAASD